MSNSIGAVKFSDGQIRFFEYRGSTDICISALWNTTKEVFDNWRKAEWKHCTCGNEEIIELHYVYGGGYYAEGYACKACKSLRQTEEQQYMEQQDKHDDWAEGIYDDEPFIDAEPATLLLQEAETNSKYRLENLAFYGVGLIEMYDHTKQQNMEENIKQIALKEDKSISAMSHKLSTVVKFETLKHMGKTVDEVMPEGYWEKLEQEFLNQSVSNWFDYLDETGCFIDKSTLRIVVLPVVSFSRRYYMEVVNHQYKNTTEQLVNTAESIDIDIVKKYICDKGQEMLTQKVYNTVNEMMVLKENHKEIKGSAYERRFYPVMYMGVMVQGEVTENHIKQFCELLNEPIEAGDLWHGCLVPMAKFKLGEFNSAGQRYRGEEWVLMSFILGKDINMDVQAYRDKYPHLDIFNHEGELPSRILE